jgi:hypothetical protein
MNHHQSRATGVKYMLAGGSIVAAIGLLISPRGLLSSTASSGDICQAVVQPKAVLSREQLSRLLAVPERSRKDQVRQIVKDPYCTLPELQVRAGAMAQREAYPLAFDPQTWFVVLYEGEEYAGYSFSFRR